MESIKYPMNPENKPLQHYLDIIERLLEEMNHIENMLDILNIGYSRQSGQDWAESSTHILTSYVRQVKTEYEKQFYQE